MNGADVSTKGVDWVLSGSHSKVACAGANFFNLSPRSTDGKYQKKAVAMMLHIVFKVAKTMAPSVIFIDEVEKVFLSDKKKLKEFSSLEPYNRIKKELAKVSCVLPGSAISQLQLLCVIPCVHALDWVRPHWQCVESENFSSHITLQVNFLPNLVCMSNNVVYLTCTAILTSVTHASCESFRK